LVLPRAGRTFVITFGHAWIQLKDEWLEPDFGRRVALNLLAPDGLREIRAEQVFARWHIASERAPHTTTVDEFGVEFDRDLVGAVEGRPVDASLGATIRGATSLRLRQPIAAIGAFLDKAERLFKSKAYRKNWPDIDNLIPVRSGGVVQKLERKLDQALARPEDRRRIVMFTPMIRRDEPLTVDSYVFGRLAAAPVRRPYLTIQGWVDVLERKGLTPSVVEARNGVVHLLDEDGVELRTCTPFQCFGYEAEVGGRQYVLSSGHWYEVATDFRDRVNRVISSIALPSIGLPPWDQVADEEAYNQSCASKDVLLFDQKIIRYGGGQSQFEFCDLFHPGKRVLVFAKIVSKSTGMSHLVEQVRRTSELLFSTDGAYRAELKRVFAQHHASADRGWLDQRPQNGDWEFCLVSLGRDAQGLPFFAKCSLMKLCTDLRERGHRVTFGRV
jgi:uncharacterized protein (TIGR04141 family)